MLEPNQFHPNDAWIVFRLNDAPISTTDDGDFNVLCLMDAASCYILGNEFVPVQGSVAPEDTAKRLIQTAQSRVGCMAARFYISAELESGHLAAVVQASGAECILASEDELSAFTSEAKEGFLAHMGSGKIQ